MSSSDISSMQKDTEQQLVSSFKTEDYISISIFWCLALLLFAQFFTRYVLGASLGWSEELARYLLILLAFSGACIATRNEAHIGVTLLHRYLPDKILCIVRLIIAILSLLVVVLLSVFAIQIATTLQLYTLASLPLSMSWVYVLIFVCLALMTVRSVMVVLEHSRTVGNIYKRKVD